MRLIDADELLRDAEEYSPISAGLADEYDVKWLVDAQPTVDAVEVVHGRTIQAKEPQHIWMDSECEKCHCLMLKTDKYCPICGAKMDGDGNDNDK